MYLNLTKLQIFLAFIYICTDKVVILILYIMISQTAYSLHGYFIFYAIGLNNLIFLGIAVHYIASFLYNEICY